MDITTLWNFYEAGSYQNCLGYAAEAIVQQNGIDSLAAAGASLIRLRRIEEGMLLLKAAATFRPNSVTLYHFACSLAQEFILEDELESFAKLSLRDFPD